jgi:hypothetical protein
MGLVLVVSTAISNNNMNDFQSDILPILMVNNFSNQLRDAAIERRTLDVPNVVFIFVTVAGCTLVYIILAMFLVPLDEPREYQFVSEDGAITALSAIFLASASAFSLSTMTVLILKRDLHKWVWLVLAFGFAFLAFDELLQFHERVGSLVERFSSSGTFRNWNDIIVIIYGILALPMLIVMLPGLLRWRMVLEIFAIAFLFYMIHTLIDSISEPRTTVSVILEESAKLLSGACLMVGAFIGFIGALWKHVGGSE